MVTLNKCGLFWALCPGKSGEKVPVRKLNIDKMSVLPRLMYRSSTIPGKVPAGHFVNIGERIRTLIEKSKRLSIAKAILKMKNEVGGLALPNLEIYQKPTVIKAAWYR